MSDFAFILVVSGTAVSLLIGVLLIIITIGGNKR